MPKNVDDPNLPSPTVYMLNRKDVIVDVNDAWNDFATNNDAPELISERVIGNSLVNYVTGDITKMYVQTVLQNVRMIGKPIRRHYRCDSPTLKRYMEMSIKPDGKNLQLAHKVIRTEDMTCTVHFNAALTPSEPQITKRCSSCGRVEAQKAVWVEANDLYAAKHGAKDVTVMVEYTICPVCEATASQ